MDIRSMIGWLWDAKSEQWKKPAPEDATWKDAAGEKRSAVITRGIGTGPDGVVREYDCMVGLPDPDVRYPKRPRDPFEVMADEGPNSAAWYRGLHNSDLF